VRLLQGRFVKKGRKEKQMAGWGDGSEELRLRLLRYLPTLGLGNKDLPSKSFEFQTAIR
tara:strand:+ start:539 stop:715 length:177 start_codon:yes stop_codon:yes gene_type:complete